MRIVTIAATAALTAAPAAAADTHLFSVATDATSQTQLTTAAGNDRSPAVSPDGRRVAFVSDRDGYDAVYVMNVDGSDQRRLTDRLSEPGYVSRYRLGSPRWSPDGETIAFDAGFDSVDPREFPSSVYIVSAEGGLPIEVGTGGTPEFSPDGRFLLFSVRPSVYSVNAFTVVPVVETGSWNLGAAEAASWAPSSSRVALARKNGDLVVVDRKGRRHWRLRAHAVAPAWSPDGRLIAFAAFGARPGIYVVRPGARRARRLVDLAEPIGVQWQPNGRWLALFSASGSFLVRRDGRLLRSLAGSPSGVAWSPDSARLAYATAEGLRVAAPPWTPALLVAQGSVSAFSWLPNGLGLVYSSSSTRIDPPATRSPSETLTARTTAS